MSKILITGSSSGLGWCLFDRLHSENHKITLYDQRRGRDVRKPMIDDVDGLDVLINCAGVNKIDWLGDVTEQDWDTVMDVNAKGIFLMTQACLPMLRASRGTVLNIVSNASHMPMRCSAAYNASKGAAHILTLQLARELAPDITVFGVAPNRLAGTGMSDAIDEQVTRTRGWTKEFAREYQRKALLTGEETPPELVAEFIAFLLADKQRHKFLTGTVIPYGA